MMEQATGMRSPLRASPNTWGGHGLRLQNLDRMPCNSEQKMPNEFRPGQTVRLRRVSAVRAAAAGGYKVIRLLPDDGGEQLYRIKSTLEAHEREAHHSDLEKT